MPKFPSGASDNRQSLYLKPDEKERLDAVATLLDSLGYKGVIDAKGRANRTQVVRYMVDYVLSDPPPKKRE